MEDLDYVKLAKSMGVEDSDIPEKETEQPEDVADIEDVNYGDC